MDGGSVDIRVDLDVGRLRRDVAAAKTELRSLSTVTVKDQFGPLLSSVRDMRTRAAALSAELGGMDVQTKRTVASSSVLAGGLSTLALRAGVVTAAVGVGIRQLDQFSDSLASTDQRARAAGVELRGVAGAAAEVNRGFRSFLSDELDHLGQAVGYDRDRLKLAEARLAISKQQVAWVQREVETLRDGSQIKFAGSPDDRAGLRGVGLAESISRTKAPAGFGLTPRLKTALAAAETTGTPAQYLAQLRRAQKFLLGQIQAGGLKTEDAKQAVYGQLGMVQDTIAAVTATSPAKTKAGTTATSGQSVRELRLENRRARAALTERTDDDVAAVKAQIAYYRSVVEHTKGVARAQAEAKMIAKQAELRNLTATQTMTATVDPAGTLGALGQGPLLAGPVGQFAQSFGYKPRAGDYLHDLQRQVKAGAGFSKDLATLGRKGLGKAARAEIAGMGQAGQQLADTLANAPKATVAAYEKAYDRREQVAARVTQQELSVTASTVTISAGSVNVAGGDGKHGKDGKAGRDGGHHPKAKDATAAALRGV